MFNTLSWSIFSSSIQVSAKSVWSLPNATLPSSNTKTKRLLPSRKLRLAATKSRKANLWRLRLPESNVLVCVLYTPMQALLCSTVYIPPSLRTLHHVQSVRYWNKIIKIWLPQCTPWYNIFAAGVLFSLKFFFYMSSIRFLLSFWVWIQAERLSELKWKVENVIYQNVQKKVEQTKKGLVIRRKKKKGRSSRKAYISFGDPQILSWNIIVEAFQAWRVVEGRKIRNSAKRTPKF